MCLICGGRIQRQGYYCDRHRRSRVELPNGFGGWAQRLVKAVFGVGSHRRHRRHPGCTLYDEPTA
jgi:hypothetical protein